MTVASLLSLSLVACVADPGPDDPSGGGGGKADGNEACTTAYIEWLLLTYKPAILAQPVDAARLTELQALAQGSPCGTELLGGAAFDTWLDLGNAVAFLPYFRQHADAAAAFHMAGEHRDQYPDYLMATAVSAETTFTAKAVLAARPPISTGAFEMESWLNFYAVHLENVLTPLWDRSIQTMIENHWIVNPGEAEFLDLITLTKPTNIRDGAFAAWVGHYEDLMRNGSHVADTEDDYVAAEPRLGCLAWEGTPLDGSIPTITEPCQRDLVLDRYKALKPTVQGLADSERWMGTFALWASLKASSPDHALANDTKQLARLEAVKPFRVKGVAAYKLWLGAIVDTASNTSVLDESVLPVEPCAGPEADELYVAFLTDHLTLPAYVISRAAPNACP